MTAKNTHENIVSSEWEMITFFVWADFWTVDFRATRTLGNGGLKLLLFWGWTSAPHICTVFKERVWIRYLLNFLRVRVAPKIRNEVTIFFFKHCYTFICKIRGLQFRPFCGIWGAEIYNYDFCVGCILVSFSNALGKCNCRHDAIRWWIRYVLTKNLFFNLLMIRRMIF